MTQTIQRTKAGRVAMVKIYLNKLVDEGNGKDEYYNSFNTSFYSLIDKEKLQFFCKDSHVERISSMTYDCEINHETFFKYRDPYLNYYSRKTSEPSHDDFFSTLKDEKDNLSILIFHLIAAGIKKDTASNNKSQDYKPNIDQDVYTSSVMAEFFLKNYEALDQWEEFLKKNYSNKDFEDSQKCNEMFAFAILILLHQDISKIPLNKNYDFESVNLRITFDYLKEALDSCSNSKRVKESFNCLSFKYGESLIDDDKTLNIDEFCRTVDPMSRLMKLSHQYADSYSQMKSKYDLYSLISEEIKIVNALMLSFKKEEFNKNINSKNAFEKINKLQKEVNSNFPYIDEFQRAKSVVRNTFVKRVIASEKSDENYLENEISKNTFYNQKIHEMKEFRDFKKSLMKKTLAPTMINSMFLSLNNHQKFLNIKNTFSEDEIAEKINQIPNDSLYGLFNNTIVSLNYAYDTLRAEGYFDFIEKCLESDQMIEEKVSFYIADNFENVKDVVWHWLTDMA